MEYNDRYRLIQDQCSGGVIAHCALRIAHFRFMVVVVVIMVAVGSMMLISQPVHAAVVRGSAVQREILPYEVLEVLFFLDTQGEDVNAIEGMVVVPHAFEVTDVRDGNSDVTFWIENPALADDGNVRFAGMIPGGRSGDDLYLFTVLVRSGASGQGMVDMRDLLVLLNDGQGTEAPSSYQPINISVSKDAVPVPEPPPRLKDMDPPESFEPIMLQDSAVADGKHAIAFMTQDKGTGVVRYEVFETRRELTYEEDVHWTEATSPHVLKDQGLKSFIYVKAIDREGNARIMRIEPQYKLAWYENNNIFGIIISVTFAIIVMVLISRNMPWRGTKH